MVFKIKRKYGCILYIQLVHNKHFIPMDPNNPIVSLLPMFLIMGIMYFLMIRPQLKKEKERKAGIAALKKGDKVVAGGIYGTVVSMEDTTATIQIDTNCKIKVDKNALQPV